MSAPVDHPPDDLSRVGVSKPDHPLPWTWSGFNRERHYLLDARFDRVLFSREAIEVASPLAAALIAAAPEMEAALRRLVEELRGFLVSDYGTTRDRDATAQIARSGIPEAEALLARLDAARKAGR